MTTTCSKFKSKSKSKFKFKSIVIRTPSPKSPTSKVLRLTSQIYRLFVKSWCRFNFITSFKVEDFTLMVNCQPLR